MVVVLVHNSFFTQFIHRPSSIVNLSYVCSISLIHFFFFSSGRVVLWLFSPERAWKKETNEEKRSHQRKLKSIPIEYAIFFVSLSSSSFFSLLSTTLIDIMFECVFQVGLMMLFSTTIKNAFPIFILNYTFLRSLVHFSLVMQEKYFYRAVSATHAMKNYGKDVSDSRSRESKRSLRTSNDCGRHFCHIQNCTNISHKLTFIAF